MTNDEILNLQAGHEFDALIAEKVMGIKKDWIHFEEDGIEFKTEIGNIRITPCAAYSTDISAAWDVIEKMGEITFRCRVEMQTRTTCTFWKAGITEYGPTQFQRWDLQPRLRFAEPHL